MRPLAGRTLSVRQQRLTDTRSGPYNPPCSGPSNPPCSGFGVCGNFNVNVGEGSMEAAERKGGRRQILEQCNQRLGAGSPQRGVQGQDSGWERGGRASPHLKTLFQATGHSGLPLLAPPVRILCPGCLEKAKVCLEHIHLLTPVTYPRHSEAPFSTADTLILQTRENWTSEKEPAACALCWLGEGPAQALAGRPWLRSAGMRSCADGGACPNITNSKRS